METVMGADYSKMCRDGTCQACGQHWPGSRKPFPWRKAVGVVLVITGITSGLCLAATPAVALAIYMNYPVLQTKTGDPNSYGVIAVIQAMIFAASMIASFAGVFGNDLFKD
jgi:hypothetical protein